jgi:acylphosphatase
LRRVLVWAHLPLALGFPIGEMGVGGRSRRIVTSQSTQRRDIYYSGLVQGVGFRYTAHRLARNYQVTGFVQNLPDGRVHMIVEGTRQEIDSFLQDVVRSMSGYIQDQAVDVVSATGEYSGFTVRF